MAVNPIGHPTQGDDPPEPPEPPKPSADTAPDPAAPVEAAVVDDVGLHALSLDGLTGAVRGGRRSAGPFESRSYRRLFVAQVVSSSGDWVGFLAIAALAGRVGSSAPDAAVGLVLSARLIPGFFFGSLFSSLLDRWDRKRVMVICDIGRGVVTASLPFVRSIPGLFAASLVLEILTLMWSPAKEASVPNLVRREHLAAANSSSLAAAYGTIVPAAVTFPLLTWVANVLHNVHFLRFLTQESLAFYLDVITFFVSALLISTLALPRRADRPGDEGSATLRSTIASTSEGWRYIRDTPMVRGVMIGFCTGLVGGGMVVPLGVTFAKEVLHGSATLFGFLELSLGLGVAAGVVLLSLTKRRMGIHQLFARSVLGGSICILAAASMWRLGFTMLFIAGLGVCAGGVYVLGFTILQGEVADEIRGRIMGVFYTLIRLCLLLAFTLAPLISGALDGLSNHLTTTDAHGKVLHHQIAIASWVIPLPGVRLTLWLGGGIIMVAGLVARRAMRGAGAGTGALPAPAGSVTPHGDPPPPPAPSA